MGDLTQEKRPEQKPQLPLLELDPRAIIHVTTLVDYIQANNLNEVKSLLTSVKNQGFLKDLLSVITNHNCDTALMVALSNQDIAKLIINEAKDAGFLKDILMIKNEDGDHALLLALKSLNQDTPKLIINEAKDAGFLKELLTAENKHGYNALMEAKSAYSGKDEEKELIKFILKYAKDNGFLEDVLRPMLKKRFELGFKINNHLASAVALNDLGDLFWEYAKVTEDFKSIIFPLIAYPDKFHYSQYSGSEN
ncbi:MAG TPA: hypothetical protein PKD37_03365 [Oligoflexia bacterium]|nr:hypothetical protein [Oligoflexia bacterium]HMP27008.1 hypothetical protein [Oligoflexia bacterium]